MPGFEQFRGERGAIADQGGRTRALEPRARAVEPARAIAGAGTQAAEILALQQLIGNRAVVQRLKGEPPRASASTEIVGRLPRGLAQGIERISGVPVDDVRVHYNSSQPHRVRALAFAGGSDIHVAPAQERLLPHEAWHVVQQRQGRVRPTMQMKGVAVSDDDALEREADVMGARAARTGSIEGVDLGPSPQHLPGRGRSGAETIQLEPEPEPTSAAAPPVVEASGALKTLLVEYVETLRALVSSPPGFAEISAALAGLMRAGEREECADFVDLVDRTKHLVADVFKRPPPRFEDLLRTPEEQEAFDRAVIHQHLGKEYITRARKAKEAKRMKKSAFFATPVRAVEVYVHEKESKKLAEKMDEYAPARRGASDSITTTAMDRATTPLQALVAPIASRYLDLFNRFYTVRLELDSVTQPLLSLFRPYLVTSITEREEMLLRTRA